MKFFSLILSLLFFIVQSLLQQAHFSVQPQERQKDFSALKANPHVLRRLLGLRLAFADLFLIDVFLKAGIEREAQPFTRLYQAFKVIGVLEPERWSMFAIGGMYLSVIKDDKAGATALMRKGMQEMESRSSMQEEKGAWMLPFALGYHLIFEENEIPEGSHWIEKAANFSSSPDYVKSLSRKVSTERGQLDLASRVITEVYEKTQNETARRELERKLLEIAASQEISELNESFENFRHTTEAYALPRDKQFLLFMRALNHNKKDLIGRSLHLNEKGVIAPRTSEQ